MSLIFHNAALERLHQPHGYSVAQLARVTDAIEQHRVLEMSPLPTGLFPASSAEGIEASGYHHVWTRDNVYVALARLENGDSAAAGAVGRALLAFYHRYRHRFDPVNADAGGPVARPHVRFDGLRLEELPDERWPHAQNDALGYCLWLCTRLVRRGALVPTPAHVDTMARLAQYFAEIRFWEDEDSGHWEETQKRSASSIGVVVAGLREWIALLGDASFDTGALSRQALIDRSGVGVERGLEALGEILPSECLQPAPLQQRRYDAALLFLVYPLHVVDGPMADRIVDDVRCRLQGAIGIRRYPGDSYWAPDYETRLPRQDWTRDYSRDIDARNRLLERPGDEAQWCIFDPVLSAYHGWRYLATGAEAHRSLQVQHFNRSLAHITPEWRCPELYYLRGGQFVPNPHVPLLWTQANLQLSLAMLRAVVR